MILDFLVKIFITPENVFGLILNILGIVGMCLIFTVWKEKWWKSLIPIYGTYVLYKHTWTNYTGVFVIQTLFVMLKIGSLSFSRKHITSNLFYAIKNYMETEQVDIDISIGKLVIAVLIFAISALIVWILQLITYAKICSKLKIKNVLLIIGIIIFPDLFLLITYLYYKRTDRGEKL